MGNWLFIVVLLIFLIFVLLGVLRGGIKIAVSLAATIVTVILVFFLTPYTSKLIVSFSPLDEFIMNQTSDTMKRALGAGDLEALGVNEESLRKAMEQANINENAFRLDGFTIDDILSGKVPVTRLENFGITLDMFEGDGAGFFGEGGSIPRSMQVQAIEQSNLPRIFQERILENNNDDIYEQLGVTTFTDYVSQFLTKLFVNVVAFLITFLVVTIILRAIIFALDIVSELPVLGIVNRLAGALVGVAVAVIVVDVIFVVLTLFYLTETGAEIYKLVEQNDFLRFLYDNNVVLNLATKFR